MSSFIHAIGGLGGAILGLGGRRNRQPWDEQPSSMGTADRSYGVGGSPVGTGTPAPEAYDPNADDVGSGGEFGDTPRPLSTAQASSPQSPLGSPGGTYNDIASRSLARRDYLINQDPRRNPHASTGRRILGGVMRVLGPAGMFADMAEYGSKGSDDLHDWQRDLALNSGLTSDAIRNKQADYTGDYHQDQILQRIDRERERKRQDDINAFRQTQDRANAAGAREYPDDFALGGGAEGATLPGATLTPRGSRDYFVAPNPFIPGDKGQHLTAPPRDWLQKEKALSEGGTLDPMEVAQLKGMAKKEGIEDVDGVFEGLDKPKTKAQLQVYRDLLRTGNSANLRMLADQLRPKVVGAGGALMTPTTTSTGAPTGDMKVINNPRTFAPPRANTGRTPTTKQTRDEVAGKVVSELRAADPNADYATLQAKAIADPRVVDAGASAEVENHLKAIKPSAKGKGGAAWMQYFNPGGKAGGAKAGAPATPTTTPPPSTPKLTEADVRARARAAKKDENAAVAAARSKGLIQ